MHVEGSVERERIKKENERSESVDVERAWMSGEANNKKLLRTPFRCFELILNNLNWVEN